MDLSPGDRIELLTMPEDPDPIPRGTRGTVRSITPMTGFTHPSSRYQVDVEWDNGRSLFLVVPPDQVRRVGKRAQAQYELGADEVALISFCLRQNRSRLRRLVRKPNKPGAVDYRSANEEKLARVEELIKKFK